MRTQDTVMLPVRQALLANSLALFVILVVWSGATKAVTRIDLYSETVEVQGRDYAARLLGYKVALSQVLVRTTGRRDIAANPALAQLLDDANRLVLQYRFLDDGQLLVSFDGPAVEEVLATYGLPLWSRERPRVLVWLAMDNGVGARTLVGGEQAGQARDFLLDLARQRGLPLIFPIMDSVDMATAPFAEIWGGFYQSVLAASERYDPDAILVGRAQRDETGYWAVRWNLQFAGEVYQFTGTIDDGVQISADWFADKFAVAPGTGPSQVRMQVSGIAGVDQYAGVQDYLVNLSMIERVEVVQASADSILFNLSLRGGMEVLHRVMALNRSLVEVPETGGAGDPQDILYYRYNQ
ncbi:MAG: DUF2066 domain-containing protein [Gammaproteobacteria bacterium]|nr:DUF2066 domain-containing protein [Gammaproteobacteria bacterium]